MTGPGLSSTPGGETSGMSDDEMRDECERILDNFLLRRRAETGEPSTAAVVFLVVGDVLEPYSVAHSRHWVISPGSAEPFAEEMTKLYGEPVQAMQPMEALTADPRDGLVLFDPEEEA